MWFHSKMVMQADPELNLLMDTPNPHSVVKDLGLPEHRLHNQGQRDHRERENGRKDRHGKEENQLLAGNRRGMRTAGPGWSAQGHRGKEGCGLKRQLGHKGTSSKTLPSSAAVARTLQVRWADESWFTFPFQLDGTEEVMVGLLPRHPRALSPLQPWMSWATGGEKKKKTWFKRTTI